MDNNTDRICVLVVRPDGYQPFKDNETEHSSGPLLPYIFTLKEICQIADQKSK